MGIVLGANRYGKAENRVVRIYRDTDAPRDPRPQRLDDRCAVTSPTRTSPATRRTCCRPTPRRTPRSPTPRSTASPRPRTTPSRSGAGCSTACEPADEAWVRVEEHAWDRVEVDGAGPRPRVRPPRHRGAHHRGGRRGETTTVASGLTDLVLLKSTGSEYRGFLRDEYTTLADADDRILATSLTATWRYAEARRDRRLGRVVRRGPGRAASRPSRRRTACAMQETLHAMGRAVARGARRRRRGLVQRAEQAPPPGRPDAVRARQPR